MTQGDGAHNQGTVFSMNAFDTFTLGGTPVTIDTDVTVTSYDTDLTGASMTIGGYQSGDSLIFTNQNGISGSYSAGTLTLTGSASPAQYTAALQSITFSTTSANTTIRTIDVVALDSNDTGNVPSNTAVDSVVVAIPAPVVMASGSTGQTFALGGSAVAVDSGLSVTSYDTNLTGASETIANYQSGDSLNFTSQNGISGNYSGGVLNLTGNATVAQYQAALRSITFSTTSATLGTRTIDVVALDANDAGDVPSNTAVDSVIVAFPPPVVTASFLTGFGYSLNGPATVDLFNGSNGRGASGGLTLGHDGSTLWGMTAFGGSYGDGTIFSIETDSVAPSTDLSFDGFDGKNPVGSVVLHADGSTLYGMTSTGGAYGYGTVFSYSITHHGSPTILLSFDGSAGKNPEGTLTLSADGSTLYGMTSAGGADNDGTVFSLPVTGGTPTTLLSFTGVNDGNGDGELTLIGSTLYGVTPHGGVNGEGNVFSIPVTGGTPTNLLSFNGTNGAFPYGGLTLSGSTLYGTTLGGGLNDGNVFSIPVTGGTPTILLSFNGTNGTQPNGILTLSSDGSTLYGTTTSDAASGYGTVFSVPITGGVSTTLAWFNSVDGQEPLGGLVLSGSTLYGTTAAGGVGDGTVFSAPASAPSVPVDALIHVTSADADITGATMTIANFQSGDSLNFTSQNGITGSYSAGVLTLTGSATTAQYQAALRSVRFTTTSSNTGTRTIDVVALDGNESSDTAVDTVQVVLAPPVLTPSNEGVDGFELGDSPVAVDTDLAVWFYGSDLTGATVTSEDFEPGDTLGFTNQNGITGSYNSSTGTLTLTGTAPSATYELALQSLTFSTTSSTAGERDLSVVASDGSLVSNTADEYAFVFIATAPKVTGGGGIANYMTGGSPVAVDSGVLVTSADTDITGATMQITNEQPGDTLNFTDTSQITGYYDSTTGLLTLSGSATPAQYQTALRGVTFSNSTNNPSTAARSIAVQADDSYSDQYTSNTITETVDINLSIPAPTVTTSGATGQTFTAGITPTNLASFSGTNGKFPWGRVTFSADGSTLYGMTADGGANGEGNIFSIPVTGGTPTNLASFNGTDGENSPGSLTLSPNGLTLYGMTEDGGSGYGTIFSIPVTGGTPTTLASFNLTDGAYPDGSLTLSADGSTLYGTTYGGGANHDGNVFSIPVTGGTPTNLASFNGTDGENPGGSLTLSPNGQTLYGTTENGGGNGYGTVFSVPVTGGIPTDLASFNDADGDYPAGSLTLSADGLTFYGMTEYGGANSKGTIFSVPVTGGMPTDLASFNGTDGAIPGGSLTLSGSTLYGMTNQGGVNSQGTVFSIPVTGGNPTTLLSFNGNNGASPRGDLTLSANGSTFYGMTEQGGANGDGTIFSLSALGGVPVAVDSGITVTSSDADLTGATVSITNVQSGDSLNFASQNGISGGYNSATGVLTLTGTTVVANYQAALQSVTFSTTSNVSGTRTIDVVADDAHDTGNVPSDTGVDFVNVAAGIPAPTVTTSGSAAQYTAGASAVTVDGGIQVNSVDANHLTGATMTISAGTLQSGDTLNFSSQNGITGSYSSGTLTLGGTATTAQYQTALQSVTFNSSSTSTQARSISVQVDDSVPARPPRPRPPTRLTCMLRPRSPPCMSRGPLGRRASTVTWEPTPWAMQPRPPWVMPCKLAPTRARTSPGSTST